MSALGMTLKKGWNIVSNPYVYPMQWLKCVVKDLNSSNIYYMQEAVDAGWLGQSLFTWDVQKDDSGAFDPTKGKYVAHNTISTQLIPNRGYWVYAYKDCYLYFEPMMLPDAKIYDDEYYTDPNTFFGMGPKTDEDYN